MKYNSINTLQMLKGQKKNYTEYSKYKKINILEGFSCFFVEMCIIKGL